LHRGPPLPPQVHLGMPRHRVMVKLEWG